MKYKVLNLSNSVLSTPEVIKSFFIFATNYCIWLASYYEALFSLFVNEAYWAKNDFIFWNKANCGFDKNLKHSLYNVCN